MRRRTTVSIFRYKRQRIKQTNKIVVLFMKEQVYILYCNYMYECKLLYTYRCAQPGADGDT